jgi:hypothetical protein
MLTTPLAGHYAPPASDSCAVPSIRCTLPSLRWRCPRTRARSRRLPRRRIVDRGSVGPHRLVNATVQRLDESEAARKALSASVASVPDTTDVSTLLGDAQPFEYTPDAVSGDVEELAASTNNPNYAAKMLGYDRDTFGDMIHAMKFENKLRGTTTLSGMTTETSISMES